MNSDLLPLDSLRTRLAISSVSSRVRSRYLPFSPISSQPVRVMKVSCREASSSRRARRASNGLCGLSPFCPMIVASSSGTSWTCSDMFAPSYVVALPRPGVDRDLDLDQRRVARLAVGGWRLDTLESPGVDVRIGRIRPAFQRHGLIRDRD